MFTTRQLQHWREKLLALRARADDNFAQLCDEAFQAAGGESGGGISNVPIHLGDLGSHETEEAVTLGLAENEAALRQEIEDALARIHDAKFGACENCTGVIPQNRLNALPYARHCVACAKKLQRPATA